MMMMMEKTKLNVNTSGTLIAFTGKELRAQYDKDSVLVVYDGDERLGAFAQWNYWCYEQK